MICLAKTTKYSKMQLLLIYFIIGFCLISAFVVDLIKWGAFKWLLNLKNRFLSGKLVTLTH